MELLYRRLVSRDMGISEEEINDYWRDHPPSVDLEDFWAITAWIEMSTRDLMNVILVQGEIEEGEDNVGLISAMRNLKLKPLRDEDLDQLRWHEKIFSDFCQVLSGDSDELPTRYLQAINLIDYLANYQRRNQEDKSVLAFLDRERWRELNYTQVSVALANCLLEAEKFLSSGNEISPDSRLQREIRNLVLPDYLICGGVVTEEPSAPLEKAIGKLTHQQLRQLSTELNIPLVMLYLSRNDTRARTINYGSNPTTLLAYVCHFIG